MQDTRLEPEETGQIGEALILASSNKWGGFKHGMDKVSFMFEIDLGGFRVDVLRTMSENLSHASPHPAGALLPVGRWKNHLDLCLHLYMVSLCVCVRPHFPFYKDTCPTGLGPPQ